MGKALVNTDVPTAKKLRYSYSNKKEAKRVKNAIVFVVQMCKRMSDGA
jgi:hypothetical protein